MELKDFKDKGLLDKLLAKKIEKYRYGKELAVIAKTLFRI